MGGAIERCLLCMGEYRASLVQKVVYTEFDATFDYPSQGTVVVVDDIVNEEGIIELKALHWGNCGMKMELGWEMGSLESNPYLLQTHGLVLNSRI